MSKGFTKNKKFIPTGSNKKSMKKNCVDSSTKMTKMKVPKQFRAYDVGTRKKVLVTENIRIVKTNNVRTALVGKAPSGKNDVYHFISSK